MQICNVCKIKGKNCQDRPCIQEIPLLSSLDAREIEEISQGIRSTEYKKGQQIFKTGDRADRLYIVCSGKMKIYKYLTDGREQILYIYSTGDFVGAFNLLKEDEYKFNAEALEDTFIITLSKSKFDEIAMKNPSITLKILEKAYERIRWAEDLVDRLSSHNADSKVASLLLNMIRDFGEKTDEGRVLNLFMNREDMGNYTGISRETMTRKLLLFQELGYIDFDGNKKIIVLNKEKLEELL